MRKTLVILVAGLTPELVGKSTPNLEQLAGRGGLRPLKTVLPAVTCTVQSTLLTGLPPSGHGAVANGWYFRELCEPLFWRQPEHFVAGEKIWETGRKRDPRFTCAKMFWWYNMYTSADWSATPRPIYRADGVKLSDHYAHPAELRDELNDKFGMFPLFRFWGPLADIVSSRWITQATLHVMETRDPTLTLCYLPHLDYNLQRLGPHLSSLRLRQDLSEVDALCGELIEFADRSGREIIVVSEYGITPVDSAVHINRALREAGLLQVRRELGGELLDAGASHAFALADHQVAHVYIKPLTPLAEVRDLILDLDGVGSVLDEAGKRALGLDHPRSGELVAIARPNRWFSYYYWLDDARAPDFAPTVEIHRKPGFDPMELFIDPKIKAPKLAVAWRLTKRKLGFRSLLDVIPITGTHLVKGSHGRLTEDPRQGPLVIASRRDLLPEGSVRAQGFKTLVLDHIFA